MATLTTHLLPDNTMKPLRHLLPILFALLVAGPALAEDSAPAQEPEVIIHEGKDKTIQEYRINGFTYAIKVIPKRGKPYFLVTTNGKDFYNAEQPNMLIPSWEIFTWK